MDQPHDEGRAYDWDETLSNPEGPGWAHHGVAVTKSGLVVTFDAEGDQVHVRSAAGETLANWSSGLTEGHDITAVTEHGREFLWIADPGIKMQLVGEGTYSAATHGEHGHVVKFSLQGERVDELPVPPLSIYQTRRFSPTAVVVDEQLVGGSGDIWVADGYGESLVHRFDQHGRYVSTLPDEFKCPHGLLVDGRRATRELCVADRENGRIQVFDLDGRFLRTIGAGMLRRPSALAISGEFLLVAELKARVTVFGLDDEVVCTIGADDGAAQREGWPNAITENGTVARPPLHHGKFNSPHGIAIDAAGNPIVAEWLIGGRVSKLTRRQ